MENQSLVTALPTQVVCIHESQSKVLGSPSKELTKISKKNIRNRLILKGEMATPRVSTMRRPLSFWSD
jgi:hypothetical protein